MVGTARAEFRKTGRILGIDETQNLLVVSWIVAMNRFCCDTCPRNHGRSVAKTSWRFFGREGLMFLTAERFGVAAFGLIFSLNELRRFFDEIQRAQITFPVVICPRNKSMLSHHDRRGLGTLFYDFLHCQAPSSKPGRIHFTYAISPPKISWVIFSQFADRRNRAMTAFGCM